MQDVFRGFLKPKLFHSTSKTAFSFLTVILLQAYSGVFRGYMACNIATELNAEDMRIWLSSLKPHIKEFVKRQNNASLLTQFLYLKIVIFA